MVFIMNKRKAMSKKLLILFIAATIIGFTFSPARAVDFPHNEQSMIGCDSCHDVFGGAEDLMLTWVTYGTDIDDTQSNSVCWSCHNDVEAPLNRTHSSLQIDNSYGDWTVQCKTCHWPHDHQNLDWAPDYYRTSGNSTDISGAVLTDNTKTWTTNEFQGMLLITNLNQETSEGNLFMYRILSNDATSITVDSTIVLITVDGRTVATIGDPFAVIYGKLVRSSVNVEEIIDQQISQTGFRDVRLFEPGNDPPSVIVTPNSFADGDTTYDGICEVCHNQTDHFQFDGSAPDQNHASQGDVVGTNCLTCHIHLDGMSPEGACTACHGFPPIEDVANSSSTGGINGLVDNPGTTGSIHAGKHDFHVNTMGYSDCNFCHYNSVGSGPTHDPGVVEEITLGFSLFSGSWQGGDYDGQTAAQVPQGYNTTGTIPGTTVTDSGNRTCTNIYCHSIVQTNGGGALVFGMAGHWQNPPPVWDTASGSIVCGSCHLNPPLTGRHTTKHLTDYSAVFDCNTCHEGGGYKRLDGPDAEHASGAVDVFINNITSISSTVDYGAGTYTGTPKAQDGYGNCESVYCHSDGQSPPNYANRTWDTVTTLDCTGCHNHEAGATAEMISGAHNTHINDSDNEVGRDLPCITCHEATVSDNTTIADFTKHVNKTKDIDINITGETDCNNIQCHSDGNFDGTLTYNNPTWNPSDTLGCVDCHGDGGTQAYPSYANGGPGGDSNSHDIHVATNSIDCGECHDATSTVGTSIDGSDTTKHVNQTADVVLDTGAYVGGSESCSNTACHGTSSDPWGTTFAVGTDTCTKCHGTL
jgi:predicted CxxxxCH...CXXCH cytochrome family protein